MDPRTSLSGVASGVALGDTFPVPPCFEDRTNYKLKTDILEKSTV